MTERTKYNPRNCEGTIVKIMGDDKIHVLWDNYTTNIYQEELLEVL